MNRLARRHIRPHFLGPNGSEKDAGVSKLLYDIMGMLATALMINYLAVSFVVLSWERAISGFQSMHFVGHIGLVVAYVALSLLPTKQRARKTV